ncbi:MAG: AAA family ATPase [Deltaproteobacteria bacterium]|nr:AAA family ATPase [Deltaproteobacteria bacterium]
MKCSSCQFNNPEGMNFCGKCGSFLTVACPSCGHLNPVGSEFCELCNEKIACTDVVPAYAKRSALEYTPRFLLERAFKYKSAMIGERKLVSVLFADVADFTTIAEKLDPEDVHEIMDGCFGILGREIHQAGGTINQYTGDGVMALFGAPIAYDDHIRPACHAALQVQTRMKEFHRKNYKRYGVTFKLRIGIHTGPVVVGAIGDNLRLDYTAVGDTTNLAARLESMAEPGTILVSDRVFQNAKGHFLFDNGGQRDVKGKKEPVQVFLLVRERAVKHVESRSARAGIPFVNREKEIDLLKKAFEKSIEHGPIITAVTGEAGIGKTSLFKHFNQFMVKERALLLEGRCRPYGQLTALFPLKRMFRSYFNLYEQDSDDQVQSKIRSKLKGSEPSASLDHFFDLFSGVEKKIEDFHLAIEWKKKTLFRAIRDFLVSISKHKPVIMVINDMQWADASTREYLTFLIQSPEKIPILIVCMGRSEPGLWFPDLPMEPIRINPLSEKQAADLFTSILGTRYFDPDICKKIVFKAGGNPLFLVEMGEALKRQELIVSKESKCTLKVPGHNIETPESIQGILAARLDALHPELKHLIQLAAVIGGEFSYDLLEPLVESPENLSNLLEKIVKEGILERDFSNDRQQYQFRQPLMQEVAYHSLLRRDRRRFHQVVGKTIETLYPKNLQANFGLLAHHFYEAKNWPKAFGYTLEAMEQASYSYACQEALTSIDRALDIISKGQWERSDEKILDLTMYKGKMHFCMGQMEAAKTVFKDLLLESRRLYDHETEAEALFRLGWISFYTHQPRSSQALLTKAIHLSRQRDFPEILLKATGFLGFVYAVLGNLKEAEHLLTEAFDLGVQLDKPEGRAWSLVNLARYYNWIGEFEKTLELCRQLDKLNQEIRSPYFRILLYFIQGSAFGALGQIEKAKQQLKAGVKQLEGVDDKFWSPRFLNTLGWVHAEIGEFQDAVRLNKQSLKEAISTGDPEIIHNAQINLVENYLALGDLSKAKKMLERVWEEVRKPGISYTRWRYKTRLFIAMGELYGRLGDKKKGLDFTRKALNLARKSGAKKHQALALLAKSQLLSQNRPSLIQKSLEKALALSLEMGTRLLTQKIRHAHKTIDSF